VQALCCFVGAVDIEIEVADLVEGRYFESPLFQQSGRCGRTRYDAVNAIFDVRQQVDEEIDGRTGADAQDYARLDELKRRLGGTALVVR